MGKKNTSFARGNRIVSRVYENDWMPQNVHQNIKGRFDVHKDILKCAIIPDEVPDLDGHKTGIRLDKNDAKEFVDDLDKEFPEFKVIIGFLRKRETVYGVYKISGVIDEDGNKRIVTRILFDDFVDVKGFHTRLEAPYIDPKIDNFVHERENLEMEEETFEDSLSVLLGI